MLKKAKGFARLTAVILILALFVLVVAWMILGRDNTATAPSSTNFEQLQTNAKNKTTNELIVERGVHIYDYYNSPGDMRAKDLAAQGYLTTRLLQAEEASQEPLLMCGVALSSSKREFVLPAISGNTATMDIVISNNGKTATAKTSWIQETSQWKLDVVTCS